MQKEENQKQFSDLISKYLSGNTNAEEVQQLEAWVMESSKNKAIFKDSKKAWILSGIKEEKQTVDIEENWVKTSAQIFKEPKVVQLNSSVNRRKWLSIAAGIALLAVVSFLLFQNTRSSGATFVQTQLESNTFDLSDGSEITLNQSSSLKYELDKETNARKVKLDGDAFFDVARDEKRPFIIETQNVEIEVLGTSFYIDSRPDQSQIQVIVTSGKVEVRSGNAKTILVANEKAIFQKDSKELIKETNEDKNFLSFKSQTLLFENARLEEVVFALNRQFNANIVIENQELKDCELDSTFKNKSLNTILKIIESSLGVQFKQSGQQIKLTGTCNQ